MTAPNGNNGRRYVGRSDPWLRPSNERGEFFDRATRARVEEMTGWLDGLRVVEAAEQILQTRPARRMRVGEPGE